MSRLYFWAIFFFFFFGLRKPFEQTWLVNVITYYISFINIRENCTLPTCGLTRFNSVYQWFKSYYLTHLRWSPLDPRYPPLSFSLKNPLYYISHNKNKIRSNILKNDLSLTILEIKSSNPNPISWPKSCLINTIIGSLLMYIIPTIYIKSCHKKKKRKNPQLKLQTQIARENKKEPINPLTPKNLNPPIHHSLLLRSQPIYTIRLLCCLADLTIPFFLFLCFSSWSRVLGCASRLNVLTKNPSMSGWQSLCLGYCC